MAFIWCAHLLLFCTCLMPYSLYCLICLLHFWDLFFIFVTNSRDQTILFKWDFKPYSACVSNCMIFAMTLWMTLQLRAPVAKQTIFFHSIHCTIVNPVSGLWDHKRLPYAQIKTDVFFLWHSLCMFKILKRMIVK